MGGVRGRVEGAATEEEDDTNQPLSFSLLLNYNNGCSHRLVEFNDTFLPEGAPRPFLRTAALRKSLHIFLHEYLSSSLTQTQIVDDESVITESLLSTKRTMT